MQAHHLVAERALPTVDAEDAPEHLGPGESTPTSTPPFATPSGREHTAIDDPMGALRWDQGGEARDERHTREHHRVSAGPCSSASAPPSSRSTPASPWVLLPRDPDDRGCRLAAHRRRRVRLRLCPHEQRRHRPRRRAAMLYAPPSPMPRASSSHPHCTLPVCGDGLVNASSGEECDDECESAVCDADCTLPVCGDGVFNVIAGEICDDGGDSTNCNADCTLAECGDGRANAAVFLFFGSSSLPNTFDLVDAEDASDAAGRKVAGAGDLNGDGFADLLIGASSGGTGGLPYLVYGGASLHTTLNLADANARFLGEVSGDEFGVGLAGAGDLNGDGFDDLVIRLAQASLAADQLAGASATKAEPRRPAGA
ncbi:MAG: VCBS repeat-containing protein [Myxococcota bacterium]